MFNERYNGRLAMFDVAHIIVLAVFVMVVVAVIALRNRLKERRADKIFRYSLASVSLVFEIVFHIWVATNGGYGIGMIPIFGLCALVNLLTIIALFLDNKKIMGVIYYWALTGAFFSLIFVDSSYGAPHFRFFHYFLVHFNFMLAAIYYVATGKISLNRKGLIISSVIVFCISILMLVLDVVFQQNWYYMLESPVKEVSDLFGLPLYSVLWIIAISMLFCGWHYLTKAIIALHKKIAK